MVPAALLFQAAPPALMAEPPNVLTLNELFEDALPGMKLIAI